jgi:hypothetical protein
MEIAVRQFRPRGLRFLLQGANITSDFFQRAEFRRLVKVAGETDFVATPGIGFDDPRIGHIGQHLAADESFDTTLTSQAVPPDEHGWIERLGCTAIVPGCGPSGGSSTGACLSPAFSPAISVWRRKNLPVGCRRSSRHVPATAGDGWRRLETAGDGWSGVALAEESGLSEGDPHAHAL